MEDVDIVVQTVNAKFYHDGGSSMGILTAQKWPYILFSKKLFQQCVSLLCYSTTSK